MKLISTYFKRLNKAFLLLLFFIVFFSSCITLNISTDSFRSQVIAGLEKEGKVLGKYAVFKYTANNLLSVYAYNEANQLVNLKIGKDTNVRFYVNNYQYKIVDVYFDSVIIDGINVIGYESRINGVKHVFPFKDVYKIKIRDRFYKVIK